jgi:hypothetical protein
MWRYDREAASSQHHPSMSEERRPYAFQSAICSFTKVLRSPPGRYSWTRKSVFRMLSSLVGSSQPTPMTFTMWRWADLQRTMSISLAISWRHISLAKTSSLKRFTATSFLTPCGSVYQASSTFANDPRPARRPDQRWRRREVESPCRVSCAPICCIDWIAVEGMRREGSAHIVRKRCIASFASKSSILSLSSGDILVVMVFILRSERDGLQQLRRAELLRTISSSSINANGACKNKYRVQIVHWLRNPRSPGRRKRSTMNSCERERSLMLKLIHENHGSRRRYDLSQSTFACMR